LLQIFWDPHNLKIKYKCSEIYNKPHIISSTISFLSSESIILNEVSQQFDVGKELNTEIITFPNNNKKKSCMLLVK
jgi:hypothetical protein